MDVKIIASGSSGNAYRVSDGKTTLLLEAGIPFRELQKALEFKISQLNGCLVTHCHKDHSKACKELARAGINIYSSEGTIEACGLSGHRIKTVKALDEIIIGTFKVLPFDVQHDAPEPLGFLIESMSTAERLLYFTDTYYIKYRFNGLTHILGECNYCRKTVWDKVESGETPTERAKRLFSSHMSLESFTMFLEANDLSKLKQIYICHMSNDHGDEKTIKETVQKLTGAEVYVC